MPSLFGESIPKLKIIRNDTNIGAVASLHKGLNAVTGDLIAIVPDDDIPSGPYFQQAKDAFAEDAG